MSDDFQMTISIPSDDDGYILLQCEYCGNLFKATAEDIESDEILHIFCPSCGLISDDYLTEDVINLALNKASNYAEDLLYDAFKDLERHSKNGLISFKAGPKPQHRSEDPIRSGIEALQITHFPCCSRSAKIKPLLRMTGCYCPFCGVKNYDVE